MVVLKVDRLRRAYGVCSKVPNGNGKHYLLFDCDGDFSFDWFAQRYQENISSYATPHGHHVIVWREVPFHEAVSEVLQCPFTDRVWISLGVKRGYMFLETRHRIGIPKGKQVTYMRIERVAS